MYAQDALQRKEKFILWSGRGGISKVCREMIFEINITER